MTFQRVLILLAVVAFLLDLALVLFTAGTATVHSEILYFGLAAFAGGHL